MESRVFNEAYDKENKDRITDIKKEKLIYCYTRMYCAVKNNRLNYGNVQTSHSAYHIRTN